MLRGLIRIAALAAFVCLVVGYGLLVLQASQQAPKTIHKNEGSTASKYEPGPLTPFGTLVSGDAVSKITQYCNSYPENEKKNWPQTYYCDLKITDSYIAFFGGMLFFVTIGLVLVGVRQYRDTRILQRAYLAVAPRGIEPYRSGDGRLSCDVSIQNAGNLPARIEFFFIDRAFSDDDKLKMFEIDEQDKQKIGWNYVIPPKGEIRKGARWINSAELDAERAKYSTGGAGNNGWVYVWGQIRYHDGFTGKRFIDFCHRYSLAGKSWTIAGKHGRQHEYGNRTDEG
jgi:hypothetical protein